MSENRRNKKSLCLPVLDNWVFSKLPQKGYKKPSREVPVVVQTNIKHEQQKKNYSFFSSFFIFTVQTATNSKRNNNNNKTKQIFFNQAPGICAWVLEPL